MDSTDLSVEGPTTKPVRNVPVYGSINAAAGYAARALARRVSIRVNGKLVRLSKVNPAEFGRLKKEIAVQIRDQFTGTDIDTVRYDFSIEMPPPLLHRLAIQRDFRGLVWSGGFALWVTQRGDTIEVTSITSGGQSQCVHYAVHLRQPTPKEEPSRKWWQILGLRSTKIGS